jgi:hypothetical protein
MSEASAQDFWLAEGLLGWRIFSKISPKAGLRPDGEPEELTLKSTWRSDEAQRCRPQKHVHSNLGMAGWARVQGGSPGEKGGRRATKVLS